MTKKICDNTSVGMLIWRQESLLLIERMKPPYGFAPPAGHVDTHGSFEDAAITEVEEEVGLSITELTLLAEGKKNNPCRRINGDWHYWKIYEGDAEGDVLPSPDETKGYLWANMEMLEELSLRTIEYINGRIAEEAWQQNPGIEPVWLEWFKDIKIL